METREAAGFLEKKGIKPSYTRLRIYRYLTESRNHPTADTIFRELSPEIPTLSKTTVYNTLTLFSERGVVQTLTIEEKENRYDAETGNHTHFKCNSCGSITDIPSPKNAIHLELPKGFHSQETQLYIYGTCPQCN